MHYNWVLVLHLFAAIAFVGTVFVEVVLIEGLHKQLSKPQMTMLESALANRSVRVMPWVIGLLFGTGLTLAWSYRDALAQPLASSFSILLVCKITLALSVLTHIATAMWWRLHGRLNGQRSRRLHYNVFAHVVVIVFLAKAMFFVSW
ncbi:hypothetical protein E9531_14615 [Lampropedia puyangensis]|uniref:Integral membrane protein n=2 Tax=Lampropedia puyangensis TaxID=1330072 RepID=A0A4S8EVF6_9BURK|nr:hypothetical protein [Lampropedia puyangensis]THT98448.1 hypothetical protein E9531_14615 [Lampropedia puyangensis]